MNFADIYQRYWKNGYDLTDLSLSGIDREMFRTLFNPVAEVFRKYPAGDCHLYTFGPGVPILGPELFVAPGYDNSSTTPSVAPYLATSVAAGNLVVWKSAVPTGKRYKVSASWDSNTSGKLVQYSIGGVYKNGTTALSGVIEDSIDASGVDNCNFFIAASAAGQTVRFTNISVCEILGYTNTYNGFSAGNYIDSTGTTQGAVDQPVGLVLDGAGRGIVPVVGDYGVPATYTNTLSGVTPTGFSAVASATAARAYLNIATNIGETYTIRGTVVSAGAGGVTVFGRNAPNGVGTTFGNTGYLGSNTPFSLNFKADSTASCFLFVAGTDGQSFVVSGISLNTGIHATQSTPGYKPTMRRGIVALNQYSKDFSSSLWAKAAGISATINSLNRITNATAFVASSSVSIPVGSTGTVAALVKAKTTGGGFGIRLQGTYPNRADAVFNLATGAVIGSAGSSFSGLVTSVAGPDENGFYLCALSATAVTSAGGSAVIGPCETTAAINGWEAGSVVLSDCYIAGSAVFSGTLTAQQIIAAGGIPLTTTAPASSSAGPFCLEFDGVDDRLNLGGPLFQMSDDHCVVVGFRPTVISAYRAPLFPAANSVSSARAGVIGVDPGGVITAYYTNDAGGFFSPQLGTVAANESFVASVLKVGSQFKGRKNAGVFCAPQTLAGTFTFDVAAFGNGTGFGAAKGNIYPAIVIKGAVSEADLLVLEKYIASISGVQL